MGTASREPRRKPRPDNLTRRVILGVANDGDPATVLAHGVGLRNAVGRVVGSFCLNVGPDLGDEFADVALGKDDNGVDVGESGEYLGSLFGWHQGTPFPFQESDGVVRVDRNDQASAELFRRVDIANVADVEQIETPIGECDVFARLPPALDLPP